MKRLSEVDAVVPLPDPQRQYSYQWATLKVGETFPIPDDIKISSMRAMASRANRRMREAGVFFKVYKKTNCVMRIT